MAAARGSAPRLQRALQRARGAGMPEDTSSSPDLEMQQADENQGSGRLSPADATESGQRSPHSDLGDALWDGDDTDSTASSPRAGRQRSDSNSAYGTEALTDVGFGSARTVGALTTAQSAGHPGLTFRLVTAARARAGL